MCVYVCVEMQFWRQKLRKAIFSALQQSVVTTVENESRTIVYFSSTLYETSSGRTSTSSRYLPARLFVASAHIDLSIGWRTACSPMLARRVHDFPWRETCSHCPPKGRTPPREIFPGDAIVVIIILNDCAIRPTVSYRRETGVLYFSMRNPTTLASRDVNDNWGARRFPFPRRNVGVRRATALLHYRMRGVND